MALLRSYPCPAAGGGGADAFSPAIAALLLERFAEAIELDVATGIVNALEMLGDEARLSFVQGLFAREGVAWRPLDVEPGFALPDVRVTLSVSVERQRRTGRNVVGVLPASQPGDELEQALAVPFDGSGTAPFGLLGGKEQIDEGDQRHLHLFPPQDLARSTSHCF